MTSVLLKAFLHSFLGAALSILLTLTLLNVTASAQSGSGPIRISGTLFVGTFADNATFVGNAPIAEIEVADAIMSLRDPAGTVVDSSKTALNGHFNLSAKPGQTYQICWEIQGQTGCVTKVEVGKSPVWAGRLRARLGVPYVFGSVLTGDARPCWVQDSFFGLDVSTEIRGAGKTTRANTQGEYILVPQPGATFILSAECEKSQAVQQVTANSQMQQVDLNLGNRAPRITSLAATDGSKFVTRTTMGQTLEMISSTRELDGDTVEYSWKLADGQMGMLGSSTSNIEKWQLPNLDGNQSVYVMARDAKGGFAFKRFEMQVGINQIDASGIAVDQLTGKPVRNATVTFGNATALTSNSGWFSLSTAAVADDRYVLNITHPNFALVSRILDKSSTGNTYQMIRTQVTTHRGDQDIDIEDKRSAGACGTAVKGGAQQVVRLASPTFYVEEMDKAGDKRAQTDQTGEHDASDKSRADQFDREEEIRKYLEAQQLCDPRGVRIRIAGGSLVDVNGMKWVGLVRASVATLNPALRALPGDYQAIDANGDRVEMLSFGAAYAEFTDVSGRKLQLVPGATAKIMVPVSAYQIASANPAIAQWSYDQKTGFWQEEAKGILTMTSDGPRYVGKTEHFSAINMDVAGNDPAFATCARVEVDAAFSAWNNLVLRAYVSYGGNSVQVKETPLDTAQYHAIYRIPFNTGTPNTLRLELRGTLGGQQLVLLDNIINTDTRPKMTGTNLWPPYPYTECGDPILLTTGPGVVPAYGDYDTTGRPSFLIGPYGEFNPSDGAQQTIDYYAALDAGSPTGAKDTLGKWWSANGFGTDGLGAGNPTYVNQAYLNHNDLGFGRDMHCLKTGGNLSCYVTNYGLANQNLHNANDAEAKNPMTRGATVAMEYDAAANSDERVQFYVFGGGVATSGRINFADLDGFGPKPVPFLCMVCHGGGPSLNGNKKVSHARFREFDLPSFRYSKNRQWDFGQTTLNGTELGNFAKLNSMVRDTTVSMPIGLLIDQWYPGGFAGNPAPVLPNPPAKWTPTSPTPDDLTYYHQVYAKTCRTCHLARDEGNPENFFVFGKLAQLAVTKFAVCGSGSPKRRFMPNAVVTYKNFWADVPRRLLYETLVGVTLNSCDD